MWYVTVSHQTLGAHRPRVECAGYGIKNLSNWQRVYNEFQMLLLEFSNLIIRMEFTKAIGIPGKPALAVDLSRPFALP